MTYVLRPNGEKFIVKSNPSKQISEHSIISFKYHNVAANGTPESAVLLHLRKDKKWDDIRTRRNLLYAVSHGKPQGPLPACRGCKQKLARGQLRIQASVIYTPPGKLRKTTKLLTTLGSGPYPGKAFFCLNPFCIHQAVKTYGRKEVFLPPFDGFVGIEEDAKNEELPQVPGVTYVRD